LSGDQCKTNNVTFVEVQQKSAGSAAGVNVAVLALALVFAYGMSL